MPSALYAPWSSLETLLEAADVPVTDLDNYTTEQLLERAQARQRPGRTKQPRDEDAPFHERPLYATRSVRVLATIERAADKKARAAGTNFNAVVCAFLETYVNGQ